MKWRADLASFEAQRGKTIDRDVLISVITEHAPKRISEMLSSHSHMIGVDFEKLESILEGFLTTGRVHNSAGIAIDDDDDDDDESIGDEDGHENLVQMIWSSGYALPQEKPSSSSILIDSGSDVDCCPPWFGDQCKLERSDDFLEDVLLGFFFSLPRDS